jgi:serine/threonine protein kinase/formylglycine-generating enzyme required for sulfatase activity
MLQAIAERLERTWESSDTVDLRQFLAQVDEPRLRLLAIHELIKTELEIRWRRRKDRFLEDYVHALPELGPLSSLPVELIYEEYRSRFLFGDKPKLESYRARFPTQYPGLQEYIRAHPIAGTNFDTIRSAHDASAKADAIPSRTSASTRQKPPERLRGEFGGRTPSGNFISVDSDYELLETIGRGNFGEVWKARAPGGVLVALKRIFRTLDDKASRQEEKALELICNLKHPYLLQTHRFSPQQDRLVVIMELADGSLTDWLKEHQKAGGKGIPVEDLLPFFAQAAEGLDFLHQRKVMHRDIKPGNLLRLNGYAKVADFGLAREQYDIMETPTFFAGTPLYMPPEMWSNKVHINSDQFSLASAYVEVRQGRRCFSARTPAEIQKQIELGKADLAGLSEAEQAVLRKALNADPEKRFPTCSAFIKALRDAIFPPPAPPPTVSGSQSRLLVVVLGFGILAALVAVLWFLPRGSPLPPPVDFPPPQGWQPSGTEVVTDLDNKRYWQRIKRIIGDQEVELIAIPQKMQSDPRTFYIMEDKVWNDLFRARMEQDDAKKAIQKWLGIGAHGELADKLESWRKGAVAPDKGISEMGIDGKQRMVPVVRVTVLEAFVFAELMGGRLPSKEQYIKAAGFGEDDNPGPFKPAPDPKNFAELGLDRGCCGPLPVRPIRQRAESIYGVRDLAGNGKEWTRSIAGDDAQQVPLQQGLNNPNTLGVVVLGHGYLNEGPWLFSKVRQGQPDTYPYGDINPELGFRIVVEIAAAR